ncbi:magnesium transporter [Halalkalibacter akibai]|uniref:Magnesium transporter MgtE n=1 Tax=Halalkalibacter akibai (strain ATCC 43226 / DSM 21942 / CIP 109018 / JCM 9157 / 1139) TaxID=1236973 RepID=W4QPP4_HALA3|nr:magnesium transporter [Halalkalibacter akibai]GAE33314.1 magnesium transporter [Halalkalibacter akibai JCM 9157]
MVKLDEQNREQYEQLILDTLQAGDRVQFRETFLELHPTDQVDIFVKLKDDTRERVYEYLTPEDFSHIFEGLEIDHQKRIYQELDENYSSEMFNNMFADDVADFLAVMTGRKAEDILKKMNKEEAEDVKELMSYAPETAGAVMTKEFVSISSTDIVSDVIEKLRNDAPDAETIYYLYVVDHLEKLVGVISLRDLITAQPTEVIEEIMSTRVVSVTDDMDQEDVAKLIKKYDFLAAPVVSKQNHLVGIITFDDVIDILEEEATEDLGEISAAKGATDVNVSSFTAAKKRSPWIIMLMFFGLITAGVIGQFEETLEEIVLLAVFIPLIMDSAGNTGTQSLAVAVRGLALGTIKRGSIGKMVKRELGTGIMLGLICMAVLSVTVTIMYGHWVLALIVGFSIFCTLSVATVIGATVPLVINKLKLDPAIASGPFITTVNDILGLLIYFSIATALLDFL